MAIKPRSTSSLVRVLFIVVFMGFSSILTRIRIRRAIITPGMETIKNAFVLYSDSR